MDFSPPPPLPLLPMFPSFMLCFLWTHVAISTPLISEKENNGFKMQIIIGSGSPQYK